MLWIDMESMHKMRITSENSGSPMTTSDGHHPFFINAISSLLGIGAMATIPAAIAYGLLFKESGMNWLQLLLAAILVALVFFLLARGVWTRQNWARTAIMTFLVVGMLFAAIRILFSLSAEVFAGERVIPLTQILKLILASLLRLLSIGLIPGAIFYGLLRYGDHFLENQAQRAFIDRSVRYVLIAAALSAIFIVMLIIAFTMAESWQAIEQIGLDTMLLGTIWRPGQEQYGLAPMMIGSILATFGAIALGLPLSLGTAILLAEVAPQPVRDTVRPAIELLAGIPSVVYGLFGMAVLAPLIQRIDIPRNTGYGLLNASVILAVMIIPTVTNIAEDSIRAVPREYKEGSLALGTTHWQTIWHVILPAARSGIIASIILGVGRALGETMAMIMVIGNSIAIPSPLTNNPLTLFLNTARTLTGNIAVEINYATGDQRSALFFTGLLLFLMIFLVNSLARYLMRERKT